MVLWTVVIMFQGVIDEVQVFVEEDDADKYLRDKVGPDSEETTDHWLTYSAEHTKFDGSAYYSCTLWGKLPAFTGPPNFSPD